MLIELDWKKNKMIKNLDINNYGKPYKKEYVKILNRIKKANRIAIFRHIMPDYDALGTQLGLATWIKDNFPEKEVICLGDNHVTFTPRVFPQMDRVNDDWFRTPHLCLIVDTANKSRTADPRAFRSKNRVKIDHHPSEDNYASINLVDPDTAAATEVVLSMIFNLRGDYILSKEAARYFYIALVGDSGRFLYNSTTPLTFSIAQELIRTGINIVDIYQSMYRREIEDLKVTGYILSNYKVSPKGIAYYTLSDKIQRDLDITVERGKENVNMFSNINGIHIWCSITEDVRDNCWRVSIRTSNCVVNEVASRWNGGGHAQASGAKLKSLAYLDDFIKDLETTID